MRRKRGRPKGSKTVEGRHHRHHQIQIHANNYVENIQDFCECIYPLGDRQNVLKVLQAIKEHKLGYGRMQTTAKELDIPYGTFNVILKKLRRLGIMTRDWRFSSVFLKKLMAITKVYGDFTGKRHQYEGILKEANDYIAKLWKEAEKEGKPPRFEPYYGDEES